MRYTVVVWWLRPVVIGEATFILLSSLSVAKETIQREHASFDCGPSERI
jgi:hypothetical protein